VSATVAFSEKSCDTEQPFTQVRPGGVVLTIRPRPLPDAETVSVRAGTNVPVTARLAVITTVQSDPLTLEQPAHADSRLSTAGTEVRSTLVP